MREFAEAARGLSGTTMRENWSRPLSKPLKPKDSTALVLLADARDYAVGLSEDRQLRQAWQHAAELMIEAAQGGLIKAATDQIERALFFDAKLTLGAKREE